MLYEKTRIIMWMAALHSGQLASMSATQRAQFSQNLAWLCGNFEVYLVGANKQTSQHRGCGTAAAGAAGTSLQISSPSLSSLAIPCDFDKATWRTSRSMDVERVITSLELVVIERRLERV